MENTVIMPEHLSLRIDNSLPELDRVSAAVEDFLGCCGVSMKDAYQIQLVLDELVTNVICHGFDAQGGQPIDISLSRSDEGLEMLIEDGGKPFNPLDAPEPDLSSPVEQRSIGGLGVHIVRKMMDHVSYTRSDGKNTLRLRRNIS